MTYTRQDVLNHFNVARGTTYTLVTLGTELLTQTLRAELRQILRDDAKAAEESQVINI
jgi:hypothetical protein